MPSIGGAKVANNVVRKRKCHYGATYMDGSTGDPPFLFHIFKGDLIMILFIFQNGGFV